MFFFSASLIHQRYSQRVGGVRLPDGGRRSGLQGKLSAQGGASVQVGGVHRQGALPSTWNGEFILWSLFPLLVNTCL